MRIRDWRIAFAVLILCLLAEWSWGGSTTNTPLLPLTDPATYRDMQTLNQTISHAPSIFIGSGAPASVPQKVGDIFVDTTTPHLYMSTATVTSSSWLLVK